MRQKLLNIFIVFIIQRQLPIIYAQNLRCQKVDFNRSTSIVNEFDECFGESLNVLKINSYAATTIVPFRPTSQFHLSATNAGLSCLQSTSRFTFDENSEIRTAIFLNRIEFGSWVRVQILDENGEQVEVVAYLEQSEGWSAFYGKVDRSIENAQIEIRTNLNLDSILAIEYVFVLNSGLPDNNCYDIDTDPPAVGPTDDPQTQEPDPETESPTDNPETESPTDNPETESPTEQTTNVPDPTDDPETELPTTDDLETELPTTDDPETEVPTEEPTGPDNENTEPTTTTTASLTPINSSQSAVYVWKSLSVLFFITTVVTSAATYYFIWLYRNLLQLRPSISNNTENMTSLPRLLVLKQNANGDHLIVGMNKC